MHKNNSVHWFPHKIKKLLAAAFKSSLILIPSIGYSYRAFHAEGSAMAVWSLWGIAAGSWMIFFATVFILYMESGPPKK